MNERYESPLAARYASEYMIRLFSPQKRIETWRRLWTELARAEMQLGLPVTEEQVRELEAHVSDIDFACTWQQIMRTYLEYRFGTSFSSVTARSFASVISSMTGDMLNMEQENAVLSLQGFLQRTDYIRYAGGSIDSLQLPAEEHRAEFMNGERENIIEVSISDVEGLEFREKEMKKYG